MPYNTPSSDNVVFGRGRILFDQFTAAGLRTGQYIHLGNCDRFAIGISPEKLEMVDYTTETSAPYKSVTTKIAIPINISGFEFADRNLRLIFMGDRTDFTQSATSETDEELAAATITELKGSFFQTSKRKISNVVLTQDVNTLVAGTDYEVYDAEAGIIRILPTSSTVADGDALEIDYDAAAIAAAALPVIRGATKTSVQGQILFIPANTTGPENEVVVWNAELTPDGDVALIADEFAKWNLTGSVQSDAAGTYGGASTDPYFRVLQRA
jgi:hypothetical protein